LKFRAARAHNPRDIAPAETQMIRFRALDWPTDRAALLALDTNFATDRFYRLRQAARSVSLEETTAPSPIYKSYSLINSVDELPTMSWVQVAHDADAVVGLAALRFEEWNRRARLEHLYVAMPHRGRGIGRLLVESAVKRARQLRARGVWVETQTTNYAALCFYERIGFVWCGLDTSLYDADGVSLEEFAIFLWRPLS
jgi:ribosomal protein S18 acetylase RimI-like enzyme